MDPRIRQALEVALPHLTHPELIDAVAEALMRDTLRLSRKVTLRMHTIYIEAPTRTLEDAVTYILSFGHDVLNSIPHEKADFILEQYGPENPSSS